MKKSYFNNTVTIYSFKVPTCYIALFIGNIRYRPNKKNIKDVKCKAHRIQFILNGNGYNIFYWFSFKMIYK